MRVASAQTHPTVLAECLQSWARGDESQDTEAGAIVVALAIQKLLKG